MIGVKPRIVMCYWFSSQWWEQRYLLFEIIFVIWVKFKQQFYGHSSTNSLTDLNKFHFNMNLVTWYMP